MTTTTESPANAPSTRKTLTLDITDMHLFISPKGVRRYTLTGPEVDGQDARPKKAILWNGVGQKLEAAMMSAGLNPRQLEAPARVTLEGEWQKQNWTDGQGKKRWSWEFKAEGFAFGNVVEKAGEAKKSQMPKENPKALKTITIITHDVRYGTTSAGTPRLNISGDDPEGKRRTAVVWSDVATKLNEKIAETVKGRGHEMVDDAHRVKLALEGFWKPSSYTDSKGEQRTSFEFVAKKFGEVVLASEAEREAAAEARAKKPATGTASRTPVRPAKALTNEDYVL